MIVHSCAQGSSDWFQLRLGRLTGSCADAMLRQPKRAGSQELEKRSTLRRRLVAERLTGLAPDEFVTNEMQRGLDLEADACFAYEVATNQVVQHCGFVSHDTLLTGCSPDGYVGDWHGVIEFKVPKSTTHIEYWQAGVLPDEYRAQCLHALYITGAQWCDFCSFDPRFPKDLELFRVRLERNETEIQAYELALTLFLREVDEAVELLRVKAVAA